MSDILDQLPDAAIELIKTAPPATTVTLTICGYPVADIAQLMVVVWISFLVINGLYKFFRWARAKGWAKDKHDDVANKKRKSTEHADDLPR